MVKIVCHKKGNNRCLFVYEAEVVPRVGEFIHLPHYGLYVVTDVCYTISDDGRPQNCNEYGEKLLFATIIVDNGGSKQF